VQADIASLVPPLWGYGRIRQTTGLADSFPIAGSPCGDQARLMRAFQRSGNDLGSMALDHAEQDKNADLEYHRGAKGCGCKQHLTRCRELHTYASLRTGSDPDNAMPAKKFRLWPDGNVLLPLACGVEHW
jgi:hypothetical protein